MKFSSLARALADLKALWLELFDEPEYAATDAVRPRPFGGEDTDRETERT